jgi:hypothetical protein
MQIEFSIGQTFEGFLRALAAAAEPVEISFRWRPQLRDPTDELMLETAVNGHAAPRVPPVVGDEPG